MINDLILKTPFGTQSIYFGKGPDFTILLKPYDKILIVSDVRLKKTRFIEPIKKLIKQSHQEISEIQIEIDNYSKNTELLMQLITSISNARLTRRSLLIAIGGGSIADLVGVAAAQYMRGINYAVIATSYISMTDGIISKVAVNHENSKNLIGAFYSPRWSLIDVSLRDQSSDIANAHGLVEVWKHALLENSSEMKTRITLALNEPTSEEELLAISKWSMRVKAKYVVPDWYDTKGVHKALSLGHTLANYLEMNALIHHAEAVLWGIVFEAFIARERALISDEFVEEILTMANTFDGIFNKYDTIRPLMNSRRVMNSIIKDKISDASKPRLVLPTSTGYTVADVTLEEINKAVTRLYTLKTAFKTKAPLLVLRA